MMILPVFCALTNNPETIAEKFSLIGYMLLTGMGTVFLVLVLLWAVIAIFGAFAKAEERREQKRIMEQVKNSPAPNDVSAPEPVEVAEPEEDDGALVAVITAAIEAYRSAEGLAGTSYRVVSFRRKNGGRSWNARSAD